MTPLVINSTKNGLLRKHSADLLSVIGLTLSVINLVCLASYDGIQTLPFLFWTLYTGALVCDLFDGFVARKLGTESKFGALLDTIHDIVLYLILPFYYLIRTIDFVSYFNNPIIFYLGWIIILIGGIFRLVRFTIQGLHKEKSPQKNFVSYYLGLPVYFVLPLSTILALLAALTHGVTLEISFLSLSILFSLAMVSVLKVVKFSPSQSLLLYTVILAAHLLIWKLGFSVITGTTSSL